MTSERERRLHFLESGPCIDADYIRRYYGIAWPFTSETASALAQYRKSSRHAVDCAEEQWSRYEIEGFMARSDLLPKKWMAARLGLAVSALDRLLERLDLFGMQRSRYEQGSEFIVESLSEDLIRHVPGMRFRTFRDHNAFCERLHAELDKAGIQIEHKERLFCDTSTRLSEYPRRFARHFDSLTFEPLSTKHSMWLDFQKPLNLPPDRCSKLYYVENRERLQRFVAGTTEPDDLEQYTQFLETLNHA